jgi:UDP-N-acetylglucosamine 4,6-dehydratase
MFKGSIIVVSGGTGFLGHNLTKKLLTYQPKAIRLFSTTEDKIEKTKKEFQEHQNIVGVFQRDVMDLEGMKMAFDGADYVIHTAAKKRIDFCEENPMSAVNTNIIGTKNVCMAAHGRVKKVLYISTDKACNPISMYGYSKACGENLITRFNTNSATTDFSAVRYGNVWGSSGSVIEKWDALYKQDKELLVTNLDITRFFMSIDQAVKFVLDSLIKMKGGELFTLDMKAIRLRDLLKGRYPGAKIKEIGFRCVEKEHEELRDGYCSKDHLVSYEELKEELSL